ncbi:hypothetical protein GM160_04190 [Guyparkeria halophila]|uniref:Uncharacterized protein n=1 Tax=Guyparkeria halophila TaxID=47960 RepID=A0A6I6CVQ0_9GAMM|nr:hypothetical protein [Guyparkeria halophila]QGT78159.1 hypothetical protein GM160_04190 [Guyparkeria halophila]
MANQHETRPMNGKTKRETMHVASHLSYFSLVCALWMAASILERDSGREWSPLLIDWAPALELKAIAFIMLFLAIRSVLNYYKKTSAETDT